MRQPTLFDDLERVTPPPVAVHERVKRPEGARWTAMKISVWERDRWVCQKCGRTCARRRHGNATLGYWATVDHIVPLIAGGWDDPVNLQTLCERCNRDKGDQIIDYRSDIDLRVALLEERERRGLLPRLSGKRNKRTEKLTVVAAVRLTEREAELLAEQYGSAGSGVRAGLERLLYAG